MDLTSAGCFAFSLSFSPLLFFSFNLPSLIRSASLKMTLEELLIFFTKNKRFVEQLGEKRNKLIFDKKIDF